jgi:hypothetical protein
MRPRISLVSSEFHSGAQALASVALSFFLLNCSLAHGQLTAAASVTTPTSLRAQSTQSALTQRWPRATNPRLSWLVLDLTNGLIVAHQGSDPDLPIPVGSLTKPFLALAYARTHNAFPHLICRGTQDRCWSLVATVRSVSKMPSPIPAMHISSISLARRTPTPSKVSYYSLACLPHLLKPHLLS